MHKHDHCLACPSQVVVVESKQHSTIVTLWHGLWACIRESSARKRAADEQRMSERTSSGSSGISTPVRLCTPGLAALACSRRLTHACMHSCMHVCWSFDSRLMQNVQHCVACLTARSPLRMRLHSSC